MAGWAGWAQISVICAALIGMGTVAMGVVRMVRWVYGRTLGQRIDGLIAEVRGYRRDQERWQARHEERDHGYPPGWYGSNGHGPSPLPTLDNAVRSHRR